ncbi:MAG: hypothetical protein ACO1SV_27600 [Fimbriimonas sp.]
MKFDHASASHVMRRKEGERPSEAKLVFAWSDTCGNSATFDKEMAMFSHASENGWELVALESRERTRAFYFKRPRS